MQRLLIAQCATSHGERLVLLGAWGRYEPDNRGGDDEFQLGIGSEQCAQAEKGEALTFRELEMSAER